MEKKLAVKEETQITEIDVEKKLRKDVEQWTKYLNQVPDGKFIKKNQFANNSEYLAISHIETKLDEVYAGLWQHENFTFQVIANEIVGSIELAVFHPSAKCWLKRTGVGATPIQTKKGLESSVENKITNTLVKDFPHLKAMCVKNAVKSLGKAFGRDLNRDIEDTYTPMVAKENKDDQLFGKK